MTTLPPLLLAALGQYAGLNALVGARIYPDIAPQGVAKPYVVWQEVSLTMANDIGGSVESGGLNNYAVQVTSWAVLGSTAREIDHQVRLAMIAASGFRCLLNDARMLPYEPDTKLFGAQSDFSVWLKT